MKHILTEPFTKEKVSQLKAGDTVLITGTIYTARDAAHKRLTEMLDRGETLPFEIKNSVIFYVGPTPARPGQAIGSAGPTTSYRMDAYTPRLLREGLLAMIGKGSRSCEVKDAVMKYGGVYFAAVGGAAALMAQCIKSAEVVAFEDLGTEAVRKLYVENMPVFVAMDSHGNEIY